MGGLFGGGGQTIKNAETPLSAFQIQSSAYGLTQGVLYGRNRITGNLLWYGDFTAVPHTTSSTQSGGKGGGGDITTENTTYTYTCSFLLGLGEGPIHSVNAYWVDKEYHADAAVFTAFSGSYTQSPWGYLTSKHPGEALAYRGTAYVAAAAYDLGSSSSLGNHNFDVTGHLPFAAGTIDGANPRDILHDIVANARYGADPDADYLDSWNDYSDYCVANGIFLSPVYDAQGEARQCFSDIIQVTNSAVFESEGKIKIVPYSDEPATGNGATYTPVTAAAYDLTDDDYLDTDQPVRVLRTPNADAYNQVQIEYKDRANQYATAIATAQDQASIELYGLRPMDKITAYGITDGETARRVAQLILQRVLYSRNTYEFTVGWRYARLEQCDYVTLTDTRIGLNKAPVRILSVDEAEDGKLAMTAEDAPPGILTSPLYDAPAGDGYIVNFNLPPGDVAAPQFFEVPPARALSGLAVGIAVTGQIADWGGAEIWASTDGDSYARLSSTYGGARYGTLAAAITADADQVARVALAGRGGQMYSGSESDANALSTLCLIDNEFVAHTTADLVSANIYDLTLHLRGEYSTSAAGHAAGGRFVRIDDAVAYSEALDLSMIGRTLYFKFLSFNIHGGARQTLADVEPYAYTVTGVMAKLAPPVLTGLDVQATANCNIVTWTNPAPETMDRVEVWRSDTDDVGEAVLAGTVRGGVGMFADYLGSGGVTMYYWVRSINLQGYPSAYLGPESATTGTITVTLADGSVTTVKLATGAVTAVKIGDEAITAPKIAANAVTAAAIAVNAIIAEKIAADAVTAAKIAAGAIETNHIKANAVTAEKIDGRGLAIKDAAGNVILGSGTSLPADYLGAGSGANLCRNSDFSAGLVGWTFAYNPLGATSGINLSPAWAVNGGVGVGCNTLYVYQPNGTSSGYCEYVSGPIAVEGGKRYMVSAYTGAHRCAVDVFAYTYDASGAVVGVFGNDTDFNNEDASGGTNLSNYKRHAQAATLPANVTAIRVVLRKGATKAGQSDSFMFVARVMVEKVGALTTVPGPWSAAGATGAFAELSQITADNISTYIAAAAIDYAQIKDAAIRNAKIQDLAVSTLKIQDNAVTIPVAAVGAGSATTPTINVGAGKVCIVAYAQATRYAPQGTMNIFKNGALWQSYTVQCAVSNGETGAYFGSRSVILIDTPGGSAYYTVGIDGNSEFSTGIFALGVMK